MDLGLTGKTALVTGGTKGIGRAVVEALAAEGARVGFCARTATDVERAEDELRAGGADVAGSALDVRDGAALVRDAQDVLDLILGVGVAAVERTGPPLDDELAAVLAAVERGAASPDALALAAGLPGDAASVALARLELMGYVTTGELGTIARTSLRPPAQPNA